VSTIERGRIAGARLDTVERLAAALDARLDVAIRWRGEQLDRLMDGAHAQLVDGPVRMLQHGGWEIAVEVSFSSFGERGSIDVLAFRADERTLLVVEVKSVVPDSPAMLLALDRKARLAIEVAALRGWEPRPIGRLLIVGEGTTSRRRIARLDATYPDRASRSGPGPQSVAAQTGPAGRRPPVPAIQACCGYSTSDDGRDPASSASQPWESADCAAKHRARRLNGESASPAGLRSGLVPASAGFGEIRRSGGLGRARAGSGGLGRSTGRRETAERRTNRPERGTRRLERCTRRREPGWSSD
jgi:hypothetical protein